MENLIKLHKAQLASDRARAALNRIQTDSSLLTIGSNGLPALYASDAIGN